MDNTIVYVLIYGNEGLLDDIDIFLTWEDAEEAFKNFTGVSYQEVENNYDLLGNKYPTKIMCTDIKNMKLLNSKLINEICDFIIKEAQKNATTLSNGLNYTVEYADIAFFNVDINSCINEQIVETLCQREEIADVLEDTDGFDIVLYSKFAPNYTLEDDIE